MDPILINGDHIVAILIALFGSTGFWTWLSSRLNKTNNTQTAETLKAVKDLKTEFEMERAITARRCILNFNGELLEGRRHTKESFDQILSDIKMERRPTLAGGSYENVIDQYNERIGHYKACADYRLDNSHGFAVGLQTLTQLVESIK